jgi:Chitobiase/beta-hexosaminidase C-terminal domain/Beta-propeller repeat
MRLGSLSPTLPVAALIGLAFAVTSTALSSAQTSKPSTAPIAPSRGAQSSSPAPSAPGKTQSLKENYGKLPISFEANRGQTEREVKFIAHGSGYELYLTKQEAVLALHEPQQGGLDEKAASGAERASAHPRPASKTEIVRMQLRGADAGATSEGVDLLPGTANYFVGSDRSKWQAGIPTYSKVRFLGVYPGIDLVYYGNERELEYDFVVAPGAKPKAIQLHFAGAQKMALTADGDLFVSTKESHIAFHKPDVYQESNGRRQPVEGHFTLLADNSAGFALGRYDHSRPLTIDPVLVYSTYLGGSSLDIVRGIAVDSSGNAYVTGSTASANFPVTAGAFQKVYKSKTLHYPISNAFITKLNPAGTALVYSTYLGGSGTDWGSSIAVDGSGDAYVAGSTSSSDFPVTQEALKTSLSGTGNAFVTELNATGTALIYSTYLGGSGSDSANGIAVDGSGDAYVAGSTFSADFPVTMGAFQGESKSTGGGNAFISKLNATGTALVYSTYLGGHGSARATAIALDGSGNVYVTGAVGATDFPVSPDAFQPENGAASTGLLNAFVSKLNAAGTALLYSTYLGGSGQEIGGSTTFIGFDFGSGIAVDSSGDAYVTGWAFSSNFPVTPGAFQTVNNAYNPPWLTCSNGFISKLNATGTALVYSTYLGGSDQGLYNGMYLCDGANAIAVDLDGNAYVTGVASSGDFPLTADAFQTSGPGFAWTLAFVTKLSTDGSALVYSTYLGGDLNWVFDRGGDYISNQYTDLGNAIAVRKSGDAYVAGRAGSSDFPTTLTAFQVSSKSYPPGALANGFVANFNLEATAAAPTFSPLPGKYVGSVSVKLSDATPGTAIYYTLDGGDPDSASQLYTGPITLTDYTTLRAIAVDSNYLPSAVAEASYSLIVQTPAPIISPATGSYPVGQTIKITDADAGATIRYTTDGSNPTTQSNWYHGPIQLTGSETIRAIAISTGDATSEVSASVYTVP